MGYNINIKAKDTEELVKAINDIIPENTTGKISDHYHTFDELYDHRITLFITLCRSVADYCNVGMNAEVWRSKKHSDGELAFGGTWFVLGINKEAGEQITYHLPIDRWDETSFAEELEVAPEWDGHTPEDVLKRLKTL